MALVPTHSNEKQMAMAQEINANPQTAPSGAIVCVCFFTTPTTLCMDRQASAAWKFHPWPAECPISTSVDTQWVFPKPNEKVLRRATGEISEPKCACQGLQQVVVSHRKP